MVLEEGMVEVAVDPEVVAEVPEGKTSHFLNYSTYLSNFVTIFIVDQGEMFVCSVT